MVQLNSNLRKTLAIALPFDGSKHFKEDLDNASPNLQGLTRKQFMSYMGELENLGFVITTYNDDRSDIGIIFSSEATSYFTDSKLENIRTAGRYCFQFLVGTSGGLIALFLSNLV